MAKKNTQAQTDLENELYGKLAKETGGILLEDTDSSAGFIDSGILSLNFIISGKMVGGGFPIGAMAEIAGPESGGKSLLGMNFLRGAQKVDGIAVLHDAENAVNKEFAIKAARVNPKKLLVTNGNSLETSFNRIQKTIRLTRENGIPKDRPICIVYDSIAASPSNSEFAQSQFDLETVSEAALKKAGGSFVEKVGDRAKTCSREFRKLMPMVKDHNVAILFINQLRAQIGGYAPMGMDTRVSAAGANSLPYFASTRLRMNPTKTLKDGKNKVLGNLVSFKCIKSRFTSPHQQATGIKLFYDRGIDPFGGLLELMIQHERIESTSPGNYVINEPWAGGKKIKFKANKEDNTIPIDILLECPALVDAKEPEEILYYADTFKNAIVAMEEVAVQEDFKVEE